MNGCPGYPDTVPDTRWGMNGCPGYPGYPFTKDGEDVHGPCETDPAMETRFSVREPKDSSNDGCNTAESLHGITREILHKEGKCEPRDPANTGSARLRRISKWSAKPA